jgi:hypothetical protein
MPVTQVNKVVDEKGIIGKGGLRRRRRTWGCWPKNINFEGYNCIEMFIAHFAGPSSYYTYFT